jgi:hypothetical protein
MKVTMFHFMPSATCRGAGAAGVRRLDLRRLRRQQRIATHGEGGNSVNLSRCLLARARGVAVMMVPAAGAR